jgi:riboflavin synthase
MVLGHVDGVGRVSAVVPVGGAIRFEVSAPADLERFLAAKGSVCLDGVSLTVNSIDGARVGVNLIPHTQAATTFGVRRVGDAVNIEVDLMARYVERLQSSE